MKFQFESVAEFMLMNGHGAYVWSAYGLTFIVLAYLLIKPVLQQKAFLRQQQKIQYKTNLNSSSTSVDPQ